MCDVLTCDALLDKHSQTQTDKQGTDIHTNVHTQTMHKQGQADRWTLSQTITMSPQPMVVSKQVQSSPWKPSFTRAILCSSACLARSGTGPLAAFESAPWLLGSELLVCESLPDC